MKLVLEIIISSGMLIIGVFKYIYKGLRAAFITMLRYKLKIGSKLLKYLENANS